MNTDQRRKMNAGLSRRMTDEAERRKCPECGRKYAINKEREDWGGGTLAFIRYCRWCDYSKVTVYDF